MTASSDHGNMTIVMQIVSKSEFKSKLLEYLRRVETKKKPLVVTHAGKPVIKVSPYTKGKKALLESLRNTVVSYKSPTKPVALKNWETLK